MTLKPLPLILSAIAAACFIGAFLKPLVCSDFSLEEVPYLERADAVIESPCEEIIDEIRHGELTSSEEKEPQEKGRLEKIDEVLEGSLEELEHTLPFDIPILETKDKAEAGIEATREWGSDILWGAGTETCNQFMEEWIQDKLYEVLDDKMGSVLDPRTGDELDWKSCRAEVEDGADTRDLGSCCGNEDGPLQTCMKWWMVDKGGGPIGDQYLVEIISRLFVSDDKPLGLMLVLFSICFPLVKVGLCLVLSIRAITPRSMRFLNITSKWSMTDVFIVALLITFFKADSFNFRFEAGTGLYLFAAGALLSSVAVMLLERACRDLKNQTPT